MERRNGANVPVAVQAGLTKTSRTLLAVPTRVLEHFARREAER